jgi:hypothetical protein
MISLNPISGEGHTSGASQILDTNGVPYTTPQAHYSQDNASPSMAVSIQGTVYNDADASGTIDEGEVGAPGITIGLYNSSGVLEGSTQTDSNGGYSFLVTAGMQYYVRMVQPKVDSKTAYQTWADGNTGVNPVTAVCKQGNITDPNGAPCSGTGVTPDPDLGALNSTADPSTFAYYSTVNMTTGNEIALADFAVSNAWGVTGATASTLVNTNVTLTNTFKGNPVISSAVIQAPTGGYVCPSEWTQADCNSLLPTSTVTADGQVKFNGMVAQYPGTYKFDVAYTDADGTTKVANDTVIVVAKPATVTVSNTITDNPGADTSMILPYTLNLTGFDGRTAASGVVASSLPTPSGFDAATTTEYPVTFENSSWFDSSLTPVSESLPTDPTAYSCPASIPDAQGCQHYLRNASSATKVTFTYDGSVVFPAGTVAGDYSFPVTYTLSDGSTVTVTAKVQVVDPPAEPMLNNDGSCARATDLTKDVLMTDSNGQVKFCLASGQSVSLPGLSQGRSMSLVQGTTTNLNNYTVTYTDSQTNPTTPQQSATVPASKITTTPRVIAFVNTIQSAAPFTVANNITGNSSDTTLKVPYLLVVTGGSNTTPLASLQCSADASTSADICKGSGNTLGFVTSSSSSSSTSYYALFYLSNSEQVAFTNIPAGMQIVVTEGTAGTSPQFSGATASSEPLLPAAYTTSWVSSTNATAPVSCASSDLWCGPGDLANNSGTHDYIVAGTATPVTITYTNNYEAIPLSGVDSGSSSYAGAELIVTAVVVVAAGTYLLVSMKRKKSLNNVLKRQNSSAGGYR